MEFNTAPISPMTSSIPITLRGNFNMAVGSFIAIYKVFMPLF
jgi:hypothetical protein